MSKIQEFEVKHANEVIDLIQHAYDMIIDKQAKRRTKE